MIIKLNLMGKLFLVWVCSLFTGWVTKPYLEGRFDWWGEILLCLALGVMGNIICMLVAKIPDIKDG